MKIEEFNSLHGKSFLEWVRSFNEGEYYTQNLIWRMQFIKLLDDEKKGIRKESDEE